MNVKYTPEPLKIYNDSIVFKRMFSGQNILQLEILRYINILLVIENCIRGGITNKNTCLVMINQTKVLTSNIMMLITNMMRFITKTSSR